MYSIGQVLVRENHWNDRMIKIHLFILDLSLIFNYFCIKCQKFEKMNFQSHISIFGEIGDRKHGYNEYIKKIWKKSHIFTNDSNRVWTPIINSLCDAKYGIRYGQHCPSGTSQFSVNMIDIHISVKFQSKNHVPIL